MKTKKQFDAVMFMREQRLSLSEKLLKMTKEEILDYFKLKSLKNHLKPCA